MAWKCSMNTTGARQMPILRSRTAIEFRRDIKAFLEVTGGVIRTDSEVPWSRPATPNLEEKFDRVRQQLSAKDRRIAELQTKLSQKGTEVAADDIKPEKIVWMFGTGRSGSTWLRNMMGDIEHYRVWDEPMVGKLFGQFYNNAQKGQLASRNFIMGEPTRRGWIDSIRTFVLNGARHAHPRLGPDEYLIVKEPNGSSGAPLLVEALPESRLIFLVRDPRDVVASVLDGAKSGSWLYERKQGNWKLEALPDSDPDAFVKRRAEIYLRDVGGARKAYEIHQGRKVLVTYEDLRADTVGTLKRIYSTLEMHVEEQELLRAVENHSWENIPEDDRGEGKFYRKASPGGWREDLTPEQAKTVEQITTPIIDEFYSTKQ